MSKPVSLLHASVLGKQNIMIVRELGCCMPISAHASLLTHAVMHADETTALGEPKPGPEGRRLLQQQAVVGRSTSLLGLVGVGAGIGLTFAIIGRLLG
jgi:hypothetical protein